MKLGGVRDLEKDRIHTEFLSAVHFLFVAFGHMYTLTYDTQDILPYRLKK